MTLGQPMVISAITTSELGATNGQLSEALKIAHGAADKHWSITPKLMLRFRPKKLLLAIFVCSWLAASGWGIWRLAAYSLAPGPQGTPPNRWPADSALARNASGFTVVIALHPECPCSQATVEELDSVLAQEPAQLQAQLLFIQLPGLPPIEDSKLWRRASRIAGARLFKDLDGREAQRFSTLTSGETRLYGPTGALLFRGGMTASRGHVGDNPGQAAILALVRREAPFYGPVATPVFGCALWNQTSVRTP